jgi:hypothetical protein
MTDPTNTFADRAPELHRFETEPMPDSAVTAEERRASEFATHSNPTLNRNNNTDPVSRRPGVQWVRPTDAAARAGSLVLDRGVELNTRLRDAVIDGVRDGRSQLHDALARRQAQLDPDDSPTRAQARVVGRAGVSR